MYTHTHTICVCVCIYVYTCVCVCVCVYIYIYIYICIYVYVYVYIYIYIYIYIYTYAHAYLYTEHNYMHPQPPLPPTHSKRIPNMKKGSRPVTMQEGAEARARAVKSSQGPRHGPSFLEVGVFKIHIRVLLHGRLSSGKDFGRKDGPDEKTKKFFSISFLFSSGPSFLSKSLPRFSF
jgi:hypothetical protein